MNRPILTRLNNTTYSKGFITVGQLCCDNVTTTDKDFTVLLQLNVDKVSMTGQVQLAAIPPEVKILLAE